MVSRVTDDKFSSQRSKNSKIIFAKEYARFVRRDFARLIRERSGPACSFTKVPKGWSRAKYTRMLETCGAGFLKGGCPLKHTENWLSQNNNLKITASLHTELFTLIYLDFDCHDGKGSIRDALTLLDLVKNKLPTAEAFITPRGVGAWVLVEHREPIREGGNIYHQVCSAEEYNQQIDRIQNYVRGVAAANNLDLSSVEVHGKVIEYSTRHYVQVQRCPDLFKCPPGEQYVGKPVLLSKLSATDWTAPVAPVKKKAALRGGSRALHRITDAHLANVNLVAKELIPAWFPNREIRVGKRLVGNDRFAEVANIIAATPPNKDGTNPYAQHKAAIQHLHAEGKLKYGYSHDVYMFVRNTMSRGGMLEAVEGGKYTPPVRNADGTIAQKGQAAKWHVLPHIRDYLLNYSSSIWTELSDLPADAGQDSHPPAEPEGMAIKSFEGILKQITKAIELPELDTNQEINNTHTIGSHYSTITLAQDWRPWCEHSHLRQKMPPEQMWAGLVELGLAV